MLSNLLEVLRQLLTEQEFKPLLSEAQSSTICKPLWSALSNLVVISKSKHFIK